MDLTMRICSLLPSATEIVAGLGLADELVAISHECDHPPNSGTKPVVVRSVIETDRPSREIDAQVRASVAERRGLYRLDDALLRTLDPTLVITQDLCDVCAVTPTEVQRAMAGLTPAPRLLSLNPSRLDDVFEDIGRIGSATHREERATQWVKALKGRVRPRVFQSAGASIGRRPRIAGRAVPSASVPVPPAGRPPHRVHGRMIAGHEGRYGSPR